MPLVYVCSLSLTLRKDTVMDEMPLDAVALGQPSSSSGLQRANGPPADGVAHVHAPPNGPGEPIAGSQQPPDEDGLYCQGLIRIQM